MNNKFSKLLLTTALALASVVTISTSVSAGEVGNVELNTLQAATKPLQAVDQIMELMFNDYKQAFDDNGGYTYNGTTLVVPSGVTAERKYIWNGSNPYIRVAMAVWGNGLWVQLYSRIVNSAIPPELSGAWFYFFPMAATTSILNLSDMSCRTSAPIQPAVAKSKILGDISTTTINNIGKIYALLRDVEGITYINGCVTNNMTIPAAVEAP